VGKYSSFTRWADRITQPNDAITGTRQRWLSIVLSTPSLYDISVLRDGNSVRLEHFERLEVDLKSGRPQDIERLGTTDVQEDATLVDIHNQLPSHEAFFTQWVRHGQWHASCMSRSNGRRL
jgi:hypothetical protein